MEGNAELITFAPFLKFVRLTGYGRLSDKMKRYKSVHEIYRYFVLAYFSIVFAQECIYAVLVCIFLYALLVLVPIKPDNFFLSTFIAVLVQSWNDITNFVRSMLLLLAHFAAAAKLVVYRSKEDQILKLINDFNDPLFYQDNQVQKDILLDSAKKSKYVFYAFLSGAFSTSLLWTIFPIIDFVKGKKIIFQYWFGNMDYNKSPEFEIVLMYTMLLFLIVAIGNTTMDTFISIILGECKTQLMLLRYNLEHLPETSMALCKENGKTYETTLDIELIKCIKHYSKIIKLTRVHEAIFGKVIFLQFNTSGWIYCMIAYKLVNMSPLSVEFATMSVYMLCMITELFLFCYYGNEVKIESEHLVESIYLMDWLSTPMRFRKSLIIFMERSKRPIIPSAYHILTLSIEAFIKILRSSYTFYAVLKETKS